MLGLFYKHPTKHLALHISIPFLVNILNPLDMIRAWGQQGGRRWGEASSKQEAKRRPKRNKLAGRRVLKIAYLQRSGMWRNRTLLVGIFRKRQQKCTDMQFLLLIPPIYTDIISYKKPIIYSKALLE
jgi:hypothetical protein